MNGDNRVNVNRSQTPQQVVPIYADPGQPGVFHSLSGGVYEVTTTSQTTVTTTYGSLQSGQRVEQCTQEYTMHGEQLGGSGEFNFASFAFNGESASAHVEHFQHQQQPAVTTDALSVTTHSADDENVSSDIISLSNPHMGPTPRTKKAAIVAAVALFLTLLAAGTFVGYRLLRNRA